MRKYHATPCCSIHMSCKGSCVPSSGLPPFPYHIDLLSSLLYDKVETMVSLWRQLKYGFPFPLKTPPSSLHLSLLSTMVGLSAEPAEPMYRVSHYTMGACSLMPCGSMTIHADKTKVPEIKALSTRCSTRASLSRKGLCAGPTTQLRPRVCQVLIQKDPSSAVKFVTL